MSDILKKGKELDRLQGALQFDVTDNGDDINTDGQQAPKKPKMVDIGTGLQSLYWSPDESFKRVPLEKMNPFVYSPEEMSDFRAENQKRWEKWIGAPAKFGTMAATTFLDNTVGFVFGALNAAAEGDDLQSATHGYVNNWFSRKMQEIQNNVAEYFPIYMTREEEQRPWYQRLGTANWWVDTVANQGFTAGVVASSALWGGLLSKGVSSLAAMRMAKGLSDTSKAANITKLPQALQAGTISPEVAGKAIMEAGRTLRGSDYAVRAAAGMQGSAAYARTEALSHATELGNQLMFQENQSWERDKPEIEAEVRREILATSVGLSSYDVDLLTQRKLSEIRKEREGNLSELIRNHTNRTFAKDLAYLTVTSNLMFGKLFSGNFSLQREAARRMVKPTAGWGAVQADPKLLAKGIEKAVQQSKKAAVVGALTKNPAVQFFEESFLHINREASGDYTKMMYDPDAYDDITTMTETYFKKLGDTFGDVDEWESGMKGFFGALLGAAGPVRSSGKRMGYTMSGGVWDAMRAMKQNPQEINQTLIDQANAFVADPKRQSFEEFLIRNNVLNREANAAIEADDVFSFENSQVSDLVNGFILFDELGMSQEFLDYMTAGLQISAADAREAFKLKDSPLYEYYNREDLDVFSKMDDSEVEATLKEQASNLEKFGKKFIEIKQNIDVLANQRGLSKGLRKELFHLAASLDNMTERATQSKAKLDPQVAVVVDEILTKVGSFMAAQVKNKPGDFSEGLLKVLETVDSEESIALKDKLTKAIEAATPNKVEQDVIAKEVGNYMALNTRINRFSDIYEMLKSENGAKDYEAKAKEYTEKLLQNIEKKAKEETQADILNNSENAIFRHVDDEQALYKGVKVDDKIFLSKWDEEKGSWQLTDTELTPDNFDSYVRNPDNTTAQKVAPETKKLLMDKIYAAKNTQELIDMVYGDFDGMYVGSDGKQRPSIRNSTVADKAAYIEAARKRYKQLTNKEAPQNFGKEDRYTETVYLSEDGSKALVINDWKNKVVYVHDYNDYIKNKNKRMSDADLRRKQKVFRNATQFLEWKATKNFSAESLFFEKIVKKAVIQGLEDLITTRKKTIQTLHDKASVIKDKISDLQKLLQAPMDKYSRTSDKRVNFEKARTTINDLNTELAKLHNELRPIVEQIKTLESERDHFLNRYVEESEGADKSTYLENIIEEYNKEIEANTQVLNSYTSFIKNIVDLVKRVKNLFYRLLEKNKGVVRWMYRPEDGGPIKELDFNGIVKEIEDSIGEDFNKRTFNDVGPIEKWKRLRQLLNLFRESTQDALDGKLNEAQAIAQYEKLQAVVRMAESKMSQNIQDLKKTRDLYEVELANYSGLRDRMINEVTPVSQGTIATKKAAASPADKVYNKQDVIHTDKKSHEEEQSFWKAPQRYLSRVFKALAGNSLAKDDSQTRYFKFVNQVSPEKIKSLKGRVVPLSSLKTKEEMSKITSMYPDAGKHHAVVLVNSDGHYIDQKGDPISEGGIPIETLDNEVVRDNAIFTPLPQANLQNQKGEDKFFTPTTLAEWQVLFPTAKSIEDATQWFEKQKVKVVEEHNALLNSIEETLTKGENFELSFTGKTAGVEVTEVTNSDGTTTSGERSVSEVFGTNTAANISIQIFSHKEASEVNTQKGEALRKPGFVYVTDKETGNTFKAQTQKLSEKNKPVIDNIIALFTYYAKQLEAGFDKTTGKVDVKEASLVELPDGSKVSIFDLISNYTFWTGDNLTAEGHKALKEALADETLTTAKAYERIYANPKYVVNTNASKRFHWRENSNVPGGEVVIGNKTVAFLDNNGEFNLALEEALRKFLSEAYFQIRKPLLGKNQKFNHLKSVNINTGTVSTEVFNTYEDFLINKKYSPITLNNVGKTDSTVESGDNTRVTHENQNLMFKTDNIQSVPESKPYNEPKKPEAPQTQPRVTVRKATPEEEAEYSGQKESPEIQRLTSEIKALVQERDKAIKNLPTEQAAVDELLKLIQKVAAKFKIHEQELRLIRESKIGEVQRKPGLWVAKEDIPRAQELTEIIDQYLASREERQNPITGKWGLSPSPFERIRREYEEKFSVLENRIDRIKEKNAKQGETTQEEAQEASSSPAITDSTPIIGYPSGSYKITLTKANRTSFNISISEGKAYLLNMLEGNPKAASIVIEALNTEDASIDHYSKIGVKVTVEPLNVIKETSLGKAPDAKKEDKPAETSDAIETERSKILKRNTEELKNNGFEIREDYESPISGEKHHYVKNKGTGQIGFKEGTFVPEGSSKALIPIQLTNGKTIYVDNLKDWEKTNIKVPVFNAKLLRESLRVTYPTLLTDEYKIDGKDASTVLSEINAKYDAELQALDKQQTAETSHAADLDVRTKSSGNYKGTENFREMKVWWEERFPGIKYDRSLHNLRKWLEENHKGVDFERLYDIVANKSWGAFYGAAVYIADNAEVGTTYHEAFHVVTTLFLDAAERTALYNETRERLGNKLVDIGFMGDTYQKQGDKLTNKEAEEFLAEEFRTYMLTGESVFESTPAKKNFFEKLKTFLGSIVESVQKLFGIETTIKPEASKIMELFRKIEQNDLPPMGGPDASVGLFARTKFEKKFTSTKQEDTQFTSPEFFSEAMRGMDYQITTALLHGEDSSIFDLFNRVSTTELYEKVRKAITEEMKKSKVPEHRAALKFILDNWEEQSVYQHKRHIRQYGIEEVTEDVVNEGRNETERGRDSGGIVPQSSLTLSSKHTASNVVKLMLSTLAKRKFDSTGKVEHIRGNRTGLVQSSEFGELYTILSDRLHNIKNLEGMLAEVDRVSQVDPTFDGIRKVLKMDSGEAVDANTALLRVQFRQAFHKDSTNFVYDIFDGKTVSKTNDASLEGVRKTIAQEFMERQSQDNPLDKEGKYKKELFELTDQERESLALETDNALDQTKFSIAERLLKVYGIHINFNSPLLTNKMKLEAYNRLNAMINNIDFNVYTGNNSENVKFFIELKKQSDLRYIETSIFNMNGDRNYLNTLYSYLTTAIGDIREGMSYEELISKYPHMSQSVYLRQMFKEIRAEKGWKDVSHVRLLIDQGVSSPTNYMRTDASKITKADRLKLRIENAFKDVFPMLQPGDNSVSRYISMEGISDLSSDNRFRVTMKEYLQQELEGLTQRDDVKNYANFLENFSEGLLMQMAMGTHKALPGELRKLYEGTYEGTAEQHIKTLMDKFWDSAFYPNITKYFDKVADSLLDTLTTNGLLTESKGKFEFVNVFPGKYGTKNLTRSDVLRILKNVQERTFVSTVEQFKMFYGDPRGYKNVLGIFQRLAGAVGTKTMSDVSGYTNTFINNHLAGINGNVPAMHNGQPVVTTLTVADTIVADSERIKGIHESYDVDNHPNKQDILKALKGYGSMSLGDKLLTFKEYEALSDKKKSEVVIKGMEEGDGGSYTSLDFWRWIKFRNGDWSFGENSLEALYQWERYVYEKVPVSERYYKDPVTGKQSKEPINPHKLPVANSLKPQYFGPNTEGKITMFKTSLMPLLPSMATPDTMLGKMHDFMVNNNVDIIANQSANKGVTTKLTDKGMPNSLYNAEGRFEINQDFVTQEIYYDLMGLQLSTGNKVKNTVVTGTQMMKQMLSNLFSAGKARNERFETYKNDYFKLNERRINSAKIVLKEKLGLRETTKNVKLVYRFGDLDTFIDNLMAEAEKREASNNVFAAIASLRYNASIDHMPNRNQIENILNSLADSTVISRKRKGGSYYQQPATGMHQFDVTRADVTFGNKTFKASDLKFYVRKDGKVSSMEVYLPDTYQGRVKAGDKLTELIGFRIPTQGLNSIEAIIVKGFLPAQAGELIIMPSEIVAKAGSDYDIDKLNIYMPNSYRDVDGNYIYIDPKTGMRPQYEEYLKHFTEKSNIKKLNAFIDSAFEEKSESEKKILRGMISLISEKTPEALIENIEATIGLMQEEMSFRGRTNEQALKKIALGNEMIEALTDALEGNEFTFIGKPMSEAEFTVQHTENAIMDVQRDILLDVDNYEQLMTPNSAYILSDFAKELKKLKGKSQDKETLMNLADMNFLADITQRYMVADGAIGIAALASTFHNMAQLEGLRIAPSFTHGKKNRVVSTRIRLPHNNTNGKIQLGELMDANAISSKKYRISEILSQWINAAVDVKKDPFMFDYNANSETLPVILYLVSAGVPIETVGLMMNQPVIEHYLNQKAAYKSVTAKSANKSKTDSDILKEMLGIGEMVSINLEQVENSTITDKFLKERIEKKSTDFSQQDLQILRDFRRYELTAGKMRDAIQGITYDTHSLGNTVAEAVIRLKLTENVVNEKLFENYDNLVNSGFIKPYKEAVEQIKDSFFTFYTQTRDDVARKLFDDMVELYHDAPLSMDAKVKVLNKFRLEFINYLLLHNTIPKGLTWENTKLTDTDNVKILTTEVGEFVSSMQKRIENGEQVVGEALFKALVPVSNEIGGMKVTNLRPVEKKLTALEENTIIESWEELYASDKEMATKLFYTAIIQGAHLPSPNNFISWVPTSIYNLYSRRIIHEQELKSAQERWEDYQKFYVEFFLKNYEDNNIVPHGFVTKWGAFGQNQLNPLADRMPFIKEWKTETETVGPEWNETVIRRKKDQRPKIYARGEGNKVTLLDNSKLKGIQDHKNNLVISGFDRILPGVSNIVEGMPFFKRLEQKVKENVKESITIQENKQKFDETGKLLVTLTYPLESGGIYKVGDNQYAKTSIVVYFDDIKEAKDGTGENLAKQAGFENLKDMQENSTSEETRAFAKSERGLYVTFLQKYESLASLQEFSESPATQSTAKVSGENISSKGSEFAKQLTNPGNTLGFDFKGKKYRNAEHAYQTWKSGTFDNIAYVSKAFKPKGSKPVNTATSYQTMVEVLTAKLSSYPELVQGIVERGGEAYLKNSTHNVTGDRFWESAGDNMFMKALTEAYTKVEGKQEDSFNVQKDAIRDADKRKPLAESEFSKLLAENEVPNVVELIDNKGYTLETPIKTSTGEITGISFNREGDSRFTFTHKKDKFLATLGAKGNWKIAYFDKEKESYYALDNDNMDAITEKFGTVKQFLSSINKNLVEDIETLEKVEYEERYRKDIIPLENNVSREQEKLREKYGNPYTLKDFIREWDSRLLENYIQGKQSKTSSANIIMITTPKLEKPSPKTFQANKLELQKLTGDREATIGHILNNFEMFFPGNSSLSQEERRVFVESLDSFEIKC